MTTREKLEADRTKTRNRLEDTVAEIYFAEAIELAQRLRARREPTEGNLLDWRRARAEAKGIRREIAVDLLCLAALGLAGEADRMKLEIRREVRRVRDQLRRESAERTLAN